LLSTSTKFYFKYCDVNVTVVLATSSNNQGLSKST